MPRRPRSERDGVLHHAVVRGNSGSPIITSVDDAARLIGALAQRFQEHGIRVWTWALVTNHLHLLPIGRIEVIAEADKRESAIESIIRVVESEHGFPPHLLESRSRHRWVTEARVEVVRRALALEVPRTCIASALGVTRQAVHGLEKKLARQERGDRELGWRVRLAG